MSLDGKLLGRARQQLKQQRLRREAELSKRTNEVYAASPRVKELDMLIRATAAEAITAALSGGENAEKAVLNIGEKNAELQRERENEIRRAGFPANYLDDSYACTECGDTGYIGTKPCKCLMRLYTEQQRRELSSIAIHDESFDNFNLTLYDDVPDMKSGISPRKAMKGVFDVCYNYAHRFEGHKLNLYLNGPTGLGKTFLSACIARTVSEKGFSVVYTAATAMFQRFEAERFSKEPEDMETVKSETRRIMHADLLIIDDLGTELSTAFTSSILYEVINYRLATGRHTVINSNLTEEQLKLRYTPQIVSRLLGEYQPLNFHGTDIRLRRRGL